MHFTKEMQKHTKRLNFPQHNKNSNWQINMLILTQLIQTETCPQTIVQRCINRHYEHKIENPI